MPRKRKKVYMNIINLDKISGPVKTVQVEAATLSGAI